MSRLDRCTWKFYGQFRECFLCSFSKLLNVFHYSFMIEHMGTERFELVVID